MSEEAVSVVKKKGQRELVIKMLVVQEQVEHEDILLHTRTPHTVMLVPFVGLLLL